MYPLSSSFFCCQIIHSVVQARDCSAEESGRAANVTCFTGKPPQGWHRWVRPIVYDLDSSRLRITVKVSRLPELIHCRWPVSHAKAGSDIQPNRFDVVCSSKLKIAVQNLTSYKWLYIQLRTHEGLTIHRPRLPSPVHEAFTGRPLNYLLPLAKSCSEGLPVYLALNHVTFAIHHYLSLA